MALKVKTNQFKDLHNNLFYLYIILARSEAGGKKEGQDPLICFYDQ